MEGPRAIPVNVLTGFLGSGKTTLLRHILRDPAYSGTAVLINEYGAVGLDHELVGAIEGAPVLLSSGCICCTIRGDLARAIRDLYDRRQQGALPPFGRVVVETTGLADPTPIVATITSDRVIRHHFRPGNVITTVDALHAGAGLAAYPVMRRQVAIADRLVLTKTDLAPPATREALRAELAALNPAAVLIQAVRGATDPSVLLGRDLHDPASRMEEARGWAAIDPPPLPHVAGIATCCLEPDGPLDWTAFGLWLSLVVHRHGARLPRVKAILNIEGSQTPVAVHAVQHVIHAPEHLPAWPTAARGSRIVLITEGLDPAAIAASFAAFMGAARLPTAPTMG